MVFEPANHLKITRGHKNMNIFRCPPQVAKYLNLINKCKTDGNELIGVDTYSASSLIIQ